MDLTSGNENSCICVCGKSFSNRPGSLTLHQGKCKRSQTRISGALEKAQALWRKRKRQHVDTVAGVDHHSCHMDRGYTAASENATERTVRLSITLNFLSLAKLIVPCQLTSSLGTNFPTSNHPGPSTDPHAEVRLCLHLAFSQPLTLSHRVLLPLPTANTYHHKLSLTFWRYARFFLLLVCLHIFIY
jgi:hypothetical protein